MTPRLLIGKHLGVGRVRFSRAGYDVTADLPNEQLVFDSAWPEIFNVDAMSINTGSLTPYQVTSGPFAKWRI